MYCTSNEYKHGMYRYNMKIENIGSLKCPEEEKCFLCGSDDEVESQRDPTDYDGERISICFKCWFSNGDLEKVIYTKKYGVKRL